METFDQAVFAEKVDHITVTGARTLTIFMKDGTSRDMTFSTKRKMPGWSKERREKFETQSKREVKLETRQKMSERIKQLRKECGKNR